MLNTKNIVVEKHARVFSSGNIEQAKEVWILFHGYGQNIKDFFESFLPFTNENVFILPEGLSRFYQKGIMGKVRSSWMTSEERNFEIEDQKDFLNKIFSDFKLENKTINILAFSQGVPAAARWIESEKIKVKSLNFWSGQIPQHISEKKDSWINQLSPCFYIGKHDQFAPLSAWKQYFNQNPHFKPTYYEGDHFFNSDHLGEFIFTP